MLVLNADTGASMIQDNTVNSAKIVNGSVTGSDTAFPVTSLLAEYTVTGAARTTIDTLADMGITLDINTHKNYRVEIELINATASGADISCFVNGDTVLTDYYTTYIQFTTAVSGGRLNSPRIAWLPPSSNSCYTSVISLVGYPIFKTHGIQLPTSSCVEDLFTTAKTATVANITQLTFTSSVAGAIGIGSKIRIYRGDI